MSQPPARSSDEVVRINAEKNWDNPYHLLLGAKWRTLLVGVIVAYVVTNSIFAELYVLVGGIENASGSFGDMFFFSVQTMATIGYGKMVPITPAANALVTVEALVGLIGFAMATAVMFAKFSKPTSKVLFSKNLVVTKRDGVPVLSFRMANERVHGLVEATVRVVFIRQDKTAEGETIMRISDMPLIRNSTALFNQTWTAFHQLNESSPMTGLTDEELKTRGARFIVTLVGIDGLSGATTYARNVYFARDILWNTRFVDIIGRNNEGALQIDLGRFHDVEPDTPRA